MLASKCSPVHCSRYALLCGNQKPDLPPFQTTTAPSSPRRFDRLLTHQYNLSTQIVGYAPQNIKAAGSRPDGFQDSSSLYGILSRRKSSGKIYDQSPPSPSTTTKRFECSIGLRSALAQLLRLVSSTCYRSPPTACTASNRSSPSAPTASQQVRPFGLGGVCPSHYASGRPVLTYHRFLGLDAHTLQSLRTSAPRFLSKTSCQV
mmetsp:Transcript_1520/g.2358  ORF Transcript_1520/g.2358 Transcript_1520/m.2358 type:complete len:204 (+) Transcript_1520:1071-1682(+)